MEEIWLPIPESVVPNIQPWYSISTQGRIWSSYSNKEIKQFAYEKTGYYHLGLRLKNNSSKHYMIHRLVLMVFNPINNMENFEVNHKDGDKSNNALYNLEWVDRQENIDHAWDNDLYHSGEKHHNAKCSNDQIRIIRQGLDQHIPYRKICEMAGIEYNNKNSSLISDIKAGRRWTTVL